MFWLKLQQSNQCNSINTTINTLGDYGTILELIQDFTLKISGKINFSEFTLSKLSFNAA